MSFKGIFQYLIFLCILAFLFFAFRPVSSKVALRVIKTVEDVTLEGGKDDIVIRLIDDDHIFYINRAANRINIDTLRDKILGKEIELYYAKHWTPLDPLGKHKAVLQLKMGNKIVY